MRAQQQSISLATNLHYHVAIQFKLTQAQKWVSQISLEMEIAVMRWRIFQSGGESMPQSSAAGADVPVC